MYLVQASHTRGDATPPRILYWFRTPPGVKVGREPFDEAARHALESEYPNLVFDWKTNRQRADAAAGDGELA